LNWLTEEGGTIAIWRHETPNSVIDRECREAYLLVSGESSIHQWCALLRVKIKGLIAYPLISYETHLFSISDELISLVFIDLFD